MVADDFNACHDESCWSRTISPVAAKVPVVVTECGFSIPWAQGLWRWIEQQHGSISYLAWTWNTCELPRHRWHLGCILPGVPAVSLRTGGGKEGLVSDYAGTATAWGKAFKAQIAQAKTDDTAAVNSSHPWSLLPLDGGDDGHSVNRAAYHPHPPCCKGCPHGPCTACRTPGANACCPCLPPFPPMPPCNTPETCTTLSVKL